MTSFLGTTMMKPEVGFGVVGTKQQVTSSPVLPWTSPSSAEVWKARLVITSYSIHYTKLYDTAS